MQLDDDYMGYGGYGDYGDYEYGGIDDDVHFDAGVKGSEPESATAGSAAEGEGGTPVPQVKAVGANGVAGGRTKSPVVGGVDEEQLRAGEEDDEDMRRMEEEEKKNEPFKVFGSACGLLSLVVCLLRMRENVLVVASICRPALVFLCSSPTAGTRTK